jgi:hypothetical protein
MEPMHVEAVRNDAAPSRTGLVQDYVRIECPQCWAAYYLYHDGMEVRLLRGYFLRASWQISGEHPNHNPVIVFENSSAVTQEKAS